jgi:hypothetical protein
MRDVDIALVLAAGVLSPAQSGGGGSITVDAALSDSSKHPVQNKVIAKEVGDLKSALDTIVRSGAVNDTASGSIASFTDGADNVPVKDLTVAVEPVQDLHGYANPWPAGGGKNKFNGTFLQGYWAYADGGWVNSNGWITTEKIPCKPSTSYTASADAKLTRWQGFVWYDANGDYISTDNLQSNVNIGLTKTSPSTAAYLIFNIAGGSDASDPISPSDVTHFQLEEGSSPTTYSPYSNICPISGFTGANVTRTGKNLVDISSPEKDGYYNTKGTYSPTNGYSCFLLPCTPDTHYTASGDFAGIKTYWDAGLNFISGINQGTGATKTFKTPADAFFFRISIAKTSIDGTQQIELGSTATDYEPYQGNTYSITFPSEAGTVYGGTLDVTTGKLTVDRAMVDLGAKNWYSTTGAGRTRFRTSITDIECISSPNIVAPMLCSAYKTETANNTYTGKQGISLQQNVADVYVYDAQRESMTTAEFKSAMSGVQLCYKLATPIVYDLTPTEVTTLLAQNNIWADCGDSTVNYRADTKLYIDKKIAAPANPAAGQYLSWNGSAWVAASLPVYNGGVA